MVSKKQVMQILAKISEDIGDLKQSGDSLVDRACNVTVDTSQKIIEEYRNAIKEVL